MYKIQSFLQQAKATGQDSLVVINSGDTALLCIADGAGGMVGGLEASRFACHLSNQTEILEKLDSPEDLEALLKTFDHEINSNHEAGETTIILALIKQGIIVGASVGDSECWMISPDSTYELTQLQYRKPLLGSGSATPISFGPLAISGTILLGSDGLFKYTVIDKIAQYVLSDQSNCLDNLTKLVMTKTENFQDDLSIILCQAK